MVTTDSEDLATRIRTLRSHGWARHLPDIDPRLDPRYTFVDWGFNLRPTEVAAAIGLVQLGRLDAFNAARADNFASFSRALGDNPLVHLPAVPDGSTVAWFGIPLIVHPSLHGELGHYLESHGIETRPILAGNLARQPALCGYEGKFPGADRIHDQGLYVGLHPHVTGDTEEVAHCINAFTESVLVAA